MAVSHSFVTTSPYTTAINSTEPLVKVPEKRLCMQQLEGERWPWNKGGGVLILSEIV